MKVLLAPDSFKGSLSAAGVAQAMATGFRRVFPEGEYVLLPVADGGEGTAETLCVATGGTLFPETVTGASGAPLSARWCLLGEGETAVVELAEAAGLTQIPPEKRDPKVTTTRGVGELLQIVLRKPGIRRVIIALGGSATNDGGAGLLTGLGARLLDAAGEELPAGGAALAELARIDLSAVSVRNTAVEILIACDVENPLLGERGASAVFGPQKGATVEEVALLDTALSRYAEVIGRDIANVAGAGAAGGTTAGILYCFPQAKLRPGIQIVLEAIGLEKHLQNADLVLTGEGRLDGQTLGGKAVVGVAAFVKERSRVPVGAIVGGIAPEVDLAEMAGRGVDAVLSIVPGPCSLEEATANAERFIADAAERAARWMAIGYKPRTV